MLTTPENKRNWFYIFFLVLSIILAVGLLSALIYVYRDNFGTYPSIKKDEWGAFGDFVGGLLNPIIAGLALFWLIYSVTLQNKELQKSSAALTETVNTANKQNQQVSIQIFESLFFQLLKTKTDVTNDILVGAKGTLIKFATYDKEHKGPPKTKNSITKINQMIESRVEGKESIKDHIILFKSHVFKSWEEFYTEAFLDYAGSYFRVSYQIVKLIDQNDSIKNLKENDGSKYSKKQKEYFDIFRATFTQYELEAFFFNCLSKYGSENFKELLEKYGMFEPLLIDFNRSNERLNLLTRYAYRYDSIIFEKNEQWDKYFEDISALKIINVEYFKKIFYVLFKNYFIFYPDITLWYSFFSNDFKEKYWDKFLNEYIDFKNGINKDNLMSRIEGEIKNINSRIIEIKDETKALKLKLNSNILNKKNIWDAILRNKSSNGVKYRNLNELKNIKETDLEIVFLFLDYGIRPEEFFQYFKLK